MSYRIVLGGPIKISSIVEMQIIVFIVDTTGGKHVRMLYCLFKIKRDFVGEERVDWVIIRIGRFNMAKLALNPGFHSKIWYLDVKWTCGGNDEVIELLYEILMDVECPVPRDMEENNRSCIRNRRWVLGVAIGTYVVRDILCAGFGGVKVLVFQDMEVLVQGHILVSNGSCSIFLEESGGGFTFRELVVAGDTDRVNGLRTVNEIQLPYVNHCFLFGDHLLSNRAV